MFADSVSSLDLDAFFGLISINQRAGRPFSAWSSLRQAGRPWPLWLVFKSNDWPHSDLRFISNQKPGHALIDTHRISRNNFISFNLSQPFYLVLIDFFYSISIISTPSFPTTATTTTLTACGPMCDRSRQDDRQYHVGHLLAQLYVCQHWRSTVQGTHQVFPLVSRFSFNLQTVPPGISVAPSPAAAAQPFPSSNFLVLIRPTFSSDFVFAASAPPLSLIAST